MEEEITPAVVACGSEFAATITRRGQLLTWGLGNRGELGHEMAYAGEVRLPAALGLLSKLPSGTVVRHARALATHYAPSCVPCRAHAAQVTFPLRCLLSSAPDLRIVSVACGHHHMLAISEIGTVWSCGRNGDGQLGNATFNDSMLLRRVMGMK